MTLPLKTRIRRAIEILLDIPLDCLSVYRELMGSRGRRLFRIPGMNRGDRIVLYKCAKNLPQNSVVVEIGSYLGSSSVMIAEALESNDGHLYCVDTWKNDAMSEGERDTWSVFQEHIRPWKHRISTKRSRSKDAAAAFHAPIDMLFIDGDHSYEGCRRDLEAWGSYVKHGGIVIFHDYPNAPGVMRAVAEGLASGRLRNGRPTSRCYLCEYNAGLDKQE